VLQEFLSHPDPAALSFYSYLNEALATAVGTIVDNRVLGEAASRTRGRNINYAHPTSRAWRRAAPVVSERWAERLPLLEDIADTYLHQGRLALGDVAASPRFLLAHEPCRVTGN